MRTIAYVVTLFMGWFLGIVMQFVFPMPNAGTPEFWIVVGVVVIFVIAGLVIAIAIDVVEKDNL